MKKTIVLPNTEAVNEFVKASKESEQIVLVSKDGFHFQIDGASILGMLSLMGTRIQVQCEYVSKALSRVMEVYQTV